MSYITKFVGEKVMLSAVLTKDGSGISGLSPTLEIRRNSDGLYLDFSASASPYWRSTGGQKELVLTESSWQIGYYAWNFDQGLYDVGPAEYTVIYRNDPPYPLMQVEIMSFSEGPSVPSCPTIRTTGSRTVVCGNVCPL